MHVPMGGTERKGGKMQLVHGRLPAPGKGQREITGRIKCSLGQVAHGGSEICVSFGD